MTSDFFLMVFILLQLSAALFPLYGENSKKVTLAAFDYPPFYFSENSTVNGIAVDVAVELFRRMDTEPVFKMYPLKRALSNLEYGYSDGLMFLIKTAERGKYLDYSIPVFKVRGADLVISRP